MNRWYPWPRFAGELGLTLVDATAGGTNLGASVDGERLRIHLDRAEWARAEFRLSVRTSEVPPAGPTDLTAHAVVSSPASQLRRPFPLKLSVSEDGVVATGDVVLNRDELAGIVTLDAHIVGLVNGRARVVGATDVWTIVVDPAEAPRPPGAPPFKFRKVDFSSAEAPLILQQHVGAYAYFEASEPAVLYVNDGIEGLWTLLHSPHAKDDKRRQRDVVAAIIARVVLESLARSAVEQVRSDESDDGLSRSQREICVQLADRHPKVTEVEDLYELMKALETASPSDVEDFWGHFDLAVDQMSGLADVMARNINEVRRG